MYMNSDGHVTDAVCSEPCSHVGSLPGSNIPLLDYSDDDGLFLSVDSPSQCHGNVTQWNFCYRRSSSRSNTHSVQFMIYRQSGNTLSYDRLPSSITVFAQDNLDSTSCLSIPLNSTKQFEIQPNDIIGVCMRDQGDINPLYVSSNTRDDAIRVPGINDDCRDNELQSLNLDSFNGNKRNYLLAEVLIGESFNFSCSFCFIQLLLS